MPYANPEHKRAYDAARYAGGPLILSIFPGIDLLGLAFQQEWPEACIVRGPDLIFGSLHDIKNFHPPAGKFDGVIGGPPCQFASRGQVASRRRTPMPPNLIPEFERVVSETQPQWFLMENVPKAPLPTVEGFIIQPILVNNRFFGGIQDRKRRFSFGTPAGKKLIVDVVLLENPQKANTVVASEGAKGFRPNGFRSPYQPRRPFREICELQGIPELDLSALTIKARYEAVGNAVPLLMGRAVAKAVKKAMGYA